MEEKILLRKYFYTSFDRKYFKYLELKFKKFTST